MNADVVNIGIAGVVGAHGIGHVLGWLPAWGLATFEGLSSRSWLLTNLVGETATRGIGGALWLAPTIGFIAAAGGFLTNQPWWQSVAAGSAVLSLVAIALFWDALPPGSRIGAIAVNLIVLAGLARGWAVA